MSKKFLVSWVDGDDIGIYDSDTSGNAILAAVKDAGYSSLECAKDFIYDKKGQMTLQAVEQRLAESDAMQS